MEQAIEQVRRHVAPMALARERTLPVADELAGLLPEGGIVRGRVLACTGPAATSLALALVAPTVATGSWLALIDLPAVGLDAVGEAGIALERVVAVASDDPAATLAAAADGFDVVLVGGAGRSRVRGPVPPAVSARVRARVQQRGAVVVVVGDPGSLPCDAVLDTADPSWEGLGDGHGRLCRRTVEVRAEGRRIPNGRRCRVHLPATGDLLPTPVEPGGSADPARRGGDRDPAAAAPDAAARGTAALAAADPDAAAPAGRSGLVLAG